MDFFVFSCLIAALLTAFYEFAGHLRARLEGKTHANGRLVLRLLVFVIVFFLFWQHLDWNAYVAAFSFPKEENIRFNNIPYLLACGVIALALGLLLIEVRNLHRARVQGRTNNISRMATAVSLVIFILPVLHATITLWDTYVDKLAAPYYSANLPEGFVGPGQ